MTHPVTHPEITIRIRFDQGAVTVDRAETTAAFETAGAPPAPPPVDEAAAADFARAPAPPNFAPGNDAPTPPEFGVGMRTAESIFAAAPEPPTFLAVDAPAGGLDPAPPPDIPDV